MFLALCMRGPVTSSACVAGQLGKPCDGLTGYVEWLTRLFIVIVATRFTIFAVRRVSSARKVADVLRPIALSMVVSSSTVLPEYNG